MAQPGGAVRHELTRTGENPAHTRRIKEDWGGGDRRSGDESGDEDGKSVEMHIAGAGNGQWQAERTGTIL